MSAGTLTYVTPSAMLVAGDYSVDTTGNGTITIAASQALVVNVPIVFSRPSTGVGSALQSILFNYAVAGADLASITQTLQFTTYSPNPANTNVPVTNAGFSLTAGSNYTGTVTVTSPVFDSNANSRRYLLQVTLTAGATAVNLTIYGATLNWLSNTIASALSIPKTSINTSLATAVGSGITLTTTAANIALTSTNTGAASTSVITVTHAQVTSTSTILVSINGYSGTYFTNGVPFAQANTIGAGSWVLTIVNTHAANALNGTLTIGVMVVT